MIALASSPDVEDRAPASPEAVKALRDLAGKLWLKKKMRGTIEAQLKNIDSEIALLEDKLLPDAMREVGKAEVELQKGWKLRLERFASGAIPKDREDEAWEWFEWMGRSDLLRHAVTITFLKGHEKAFWRFLSDLSRRKKKLPFVIDKGLHAGTLKVFVRERAELERVGAVAPDKVMPRDLLGVHEGTRAVLVGPEEKGK